MYSKLSKTLLMPVSLMILAFAFSACKKDVPVKSVHLNPTSASLSVGGTQQLSATISPTDATNKEVTWSSSTSNVASVSSNGFVTAVSEGSATITVTTVDGNKTATCEVTVSIPVTSVTISPSSFTLNVGGTQQLTATVAPDNATNKNVTWRVDPPYYVRVSENGLVTAYSVATKDIYATAGGITATCRVTVLDVVDVENVTLAPSTVTLNPGGTQQLIAEVLPSGATNKEVTWSSSAANVATVNADGLVTAVASGITTITVKTVDGGKEATCLINVNPEIAMQNVALKGIVKDILGNPISGVHVVTGSLNTTTGSDGKYSFTQVNVINNRAVIQFKKNGYYSLTRSYVKQNDMFIDAVLYPQENSTISLQTIFPASSEKTLEVSGMKVALPASSVMYADGTAFTGNINVSMLYLDPNNENFAGMMPGGDLAAIQTDGSEVLLISYGMTNVVLTDDAGVPLQIKNDSKAELTFPIPADMNNNPPSTIPLWHFNEDKGIWIESGVATRQGNVYVGSVTHFSWCNLDIPAAQRVEIKGTVTDCNNNPLQELKVKCYQSYVYTNSAGAYSIIVPENTPVIVSLSFNGNIYSKEIPGAPGKTTYNVEVIKLPCDEPRLYIETKIEKAIIEHVYRQTPPNDGENTETRFYTTFDNYGKRIRRDYHWINNDLDPFGNYGNSNIAHARRHIQILNHINNTYYQRAEWWNGRGTNSGWLSIGGWEHYSYDFGIEFIDIIGSVYVPPVIVDETAFTSQGYARLSDTTIDSHTCHVYNYKSTSSERTYAISDGLVLWMEFKYTNYTQTYELKRMDYDVPESVFTPGAFSWPPKEWLSPNFQKIWQ